MFSRRRLVPAFTIAIALGGVGFAHAQLVDESTPPEVRNSKYQFVGVVSGNDVALRCGPSEGHYATAALARGQQLTVVGIEGDWLKVIPPEGSFSYVAKAFVEKRGDGSVGRVMKSELNVRAGSSLDNRKSQVQTRLSIGDDVQIIGEHEEYFKIKPPAGAFLFVDQQFVEPVKVINGSAEAAGTVQSANTPVIEAVVEAEQPAASPFGEPIAETPATVEGEEAVAEAGTDAAEPVASTPAVVGNPEVAFDSLEARLRESADKDLTEQPINELLDGYAQLAGDTQLPDSLRRIAESRVTALKVRQSARDELAALRAERASRAQELQPLIAEQEEIQQVIEKQDVKVFTAVGVLRNSSLQDGQKTLYRITDPSNGRTLVYIRTGDARVAQLMGRFVGVNGSVRQDADLNLQVIHPDSLQPVDPALVGTRVAAQFVPPHLLNQNAATASVPAEQ